MRSFLALAPPERARRLEAALPPGTALEAFESVEATLVRLADGPAPVGLLLARLPEGPERRQVLLALRDALRGCPRLFWTGPQDDVDCVAEVVEFGELSRVLPPECSDAVLERALRALAGECDRRRAERLEREHLEFAHEVLRETVRALELRVESARREVSGLGPVLTALRASSSLDELACRAAAAVAACLPGRGVRVALEGVGPAHEARAGASGDRPLSTWRLRGAEGDLGLLEVTTGVCDEPLGSAEAAQAGACEAMLTLAAEAVRHRSERDAAQRATLLGLARLAESRDDSTGYHLERVSSYCRLLATCVRVDGRHVEVLTDRYVLDLERSAPLHDIGKVSVPDAILNKPGRLNEEEWAVMRRHAEDGAQTLEAIVASTGEQPYLRLALEITRCHHERWDGSGYPRGLRGTEIPLSARIMAVADVYDALTSVRPYKEAWSHADAVAQIDALSGSQFDPELVETFLAHADEFDAERARLKDPHAIGARA